MWLLHTHCECCTCDTVTDLVDVGTLLEQASLLGMRMTHRGRIFVFHLVLCTLEDLDILLSL